MAETGSAVGQAKRQARPVFDNASLSITAAPVHNSDRVA
jgi:hypothetical protein